MLFNELIFQKLSYSWKRSTDSRLEVKYIKVKYPSDHSARSFFIKKSVSLKILWKHETCETIWELHEQNPLPKLWPTVAFWPSPCRYICINASVVSQAWAATPEHCFPTLSSFASLIYQQTTSNPLNLSFRKTDHLELQYYWTSVRYSFISLLVHLSQCFCLVFDTRKLLLMTVKSLTGDSL